MVNQYDRIYGIVRRNIDEDLGKASGSTSRDKELAGKDAALATANRKARLKTAVNALPPNKEAQAYAARVNPSGKGGGAGVARLAPTTPTKSPQVPLARRAGQAVGRFGRSRTGRAVRFTGRAGAGAVRGAGNLAAGAVKADFAGAKAVARFAMRPRRPRNATRVVHQTAPQPSTHFGQPSKPPEVKL